MKKFHEVETALNDKHFYLYIIDKICKYLSIDVSSHRDLVETENEILNTLVENEKKLKALEIIKDKNVFVWGFIHRKEIKDFEYTYYYYKNCYGYFHSGYDYKLLTKEEFDLLKEVLK